MSTSFGRERILWKMTTTTNTLSPLCASRTQVSVSVWYWCTTVHTDAVYKRQTSYTVRCCFYFNACVSFVLANFYRKIEFYPRKVYETNQKTWMVVKIISYLRCPHLFGRCHPVYLGPPQCYLKYTILCLFRLFNYLMLFFRLQSKWLIASAVHGILSVTLM